MDLSLITEVTVSSSEERANRLLGEGWVLLKVAEGKDEEGYPIVWYSLGFPGREFEESDEPEPPERELL